MVVRSPHLPERSVLQFDGHFLSIGLGPDLRGQELVDDAPPLAIDPVPNGLFGLGLFRNKCQ